MPNTYKMTRTHRTITRSQDNPPAVPPVPALRRAPKLRSRLDVGERLRQTVSFLARIGFSRSCSNFCHRFLDRFHRGTHPGPLRGSAEGMRVADAYEIRGSQCANIYLSLLFSLYCCHRRPLQKTRLRG